MEKNLITKPIVAIVGRPNVGKSTLFNRIIKRREAIVDDTPGITRDRKHADTDWESMQFTLVDTGGYIPGSRDVIEAGVTRQVDLAIKESDLILFLVDCNTGITDVDASVAKLLRKSQKSCILAVNKVENANQELAASEFIKLGLGEPVPVSALEGRSVGDLLSLIVEKFNLYEDEKISTNETIIRLAIVGRPNVGKSTFINAVLGKERLLVTEIPGTTRDTVDVCVKFQGREYLLVDTAGLRKRSKVNKRIEYYSTLRTHRAVERCHVASVFVDAADAITQQDLRIVSEVVEAKKGIILVVNKWDLVKKDHEKVLRWKTDLENRLQGMSFVPVLFVSCKTNLRIKKVLDTAWQIWIERGKRISSPELNKFIENLNNRYQPPAVQGKRIRILYGTQVKVNPPVFAFFSNYPNLIKDSYKRFMENQIRENFKFQGVPITLVFKRK